ncbi:MAG: pseudaminic acid biosynthesis-associated methylase [Pirellulaceae bacterium]|nr:pseudaminic acid biosynthesis-associated methylase [Pirellulaceae bacterium]
MITDNAFTTAQEQFWAGQFGNEYVDRNAAEQLLVSNTALFAEILRRTESIDSVIEFGANIGMNLHALRRLLPESKFHAVEINSKAAEQLRKAEFVNVIEDSILTFQPSAPCELAFIKGVLIHIDPERLGDVYDRLYAASSKYVCVVEYYNPTPVELNYRGHEGKLFKRDFAGEILDRFDDLRLVDYGFVYRRDRFPQDDLTWFLMEKR